MAVDITTPLNTAFREFKRYTGDGLANEPTGAPLPIGDPQSGVHNPKKADIREAIGGVAQAVENAANRAEQALADLVAGAVLDESVTFPKLAPSLLPTQAEAETGTAADKVPTVERVAQMISARASALIFDTVADVAAATIPASVDFIAVPGSGAVADFLPATPSPVKPWHVLSDNGRYFELRFPDGRVNLRAFAGSNQGLDATDDTDVIKHAMDYINRAWWQDSGNTQGKWQRGQVYVPPGIWRINPDTTDDANAIPYDYMKLVGAGDGQSMLKAHTTGAGSLIRRPATVTFGSTQRTTHTLIRGIRFILTGADQTALDMAHCGRMMITENEFTRQDRDDQRANAKQTALTGTRGVLLRNNNVTFVGGDIVTIDKNHFYFLDRGVDSGNGATAPGPEALQVTRNELSDCLNPITINDYGGAGGLLADNVIQRWAIGSRAIDLVGRMWTIRERYLECIDNDRAPILLRTGCRNIVVHRKSPVNYTAHAKTGSPLAASLGTNDSGAGTGLECVDEYGTTLAATFYGFPE